jgi:acid phosphatase type 7
MRNIRYLAGACIISVALASEAQQRWLEASDTKLSTDGQPHSITLPNAGSGPTTIAVAPDGHVWFTESAGNRIGRVNPDGSELQEFDLPHPNSSPRIIARGADGNMWFSEHTGNRIGRITPQGQITEFDIPTPASQPRAIALGADGNIWFGMFAGGKVGRITPAGAITEFVPPTANSGPRALAAGPDGNIWFSEYRGNKIGRITPAGKITEFAMPRANSGPGDITAGADGALWFVELSGGMDGFTTDGNRVGRITVSGAITEFAMPGTQTVSAINIAVGPDRNTWYTRGATLARVTPSGEITEFPLGAAARAVGLSAGSDREPPRRLVNRLWFADGGQNQISYLPFSDQPGAGQPGVDQPGLVVSADPLNVPDTQLRDPLVFVIYGDMRFTHPTETVASSPGPRRALVVKVGAENPDALFLTGDVPWHGGDTDDYREFGEETALWRQQHLRVYPVLGNHEFYNCAEATCLENWWQAFPQFRGRRWYAVALGTKVRAFALDSDASLLPGSEQRAWLEHEMQTLPREVRFVILALHHPPVADTGFLIVRSNERSLARYLKSVAPKLSAQIVVCAGHVHNYERFERDGIVYLVSGGGGAKPLVVHRGGSDRYRDRAFPNFHYIRFELQGERLRAEMVRLEDYDTPSPQVWAIKDRFEVSGKNVKPK